MFHVHPFRVLRPRASSRALGSLAGFWKADSRQSQSGSSLDRTSGSAGGRVPASLSRSTATSTGRAPHATLRGSAASGRSATSAVESSASSAAASSATSSRVSVSATSSPASASATLTPTLTPATSSASLASELASPSVLSTSGPITSGPITSGENSTHRSAHKSPSSAAPTITRQPCPLWTAASTLNLSRSRTCPPVQFIFAPFLEGQRPPQPQSSHRPSPRPPSPPPTKTLQLTAPRAAPPILSTHPPILRTLSSPLHTPAARMAEVSVAASICLRHGPIFTTPSPLPLLPTLMTPVTPPITYPFEVSGQATNLLLRQWFRPHAARCLRRRPHSSFPRSSRTELTFFPPFVARPTSLLVRVAFLVRFLVRKLVQLRRGSGWGRNGSNVLVSGFPVNHDERQPCEALLQLSAQLAHSHYALWNWWGDWLTGAVRSPAQYPPTTRK